MARVLACVAAIVIAIGVASLVRAQPAADKAGKPEPLAPPTAPSTVAAPAAPAVPTSAAPVDPATVDPAAAAPTAAMTDLPTGLGLPLVVRVAASIVDLRAIDDRGSTFSATIDLRLRWRDPRLSDPRAPDGTFALVRDAELDARLATMWSPELGFRNQVAEPIRVRRSLRVFATGEVELLERLSGQFTSPFDLSQFPFDRQDLRIELTSRRDRDTLVALDVRADDLEFSQDSTRAHLDGWAPLKVAITRITDVGWYGDAQDGMVVAMTVERQPGAGVLAIFIPLFAVLMIPILALWLNRMEGGEFKIAAVDLTNLLLGGLFAVIALNFTIGSTYPTLMTGDNTITRLFGLIYLTLGTTLAFNIAMVRFGIVRRWFGTYVQEQVFRFVAWALPTMTIATAIAIVVASMA
jgi:hypothetical protein